VSHSAPSPETPGPIIRVEDLRVRAKTPRGVIELVRGLSYEVEAAQCLAVVGESGAGKSISIRAALGLLDERRYDVSGRIWLDGVEVSALSHRRRRAYVASVASMVFQDPSRSLNPTMRVGEQITETLLHGSGRSQRKRSRKESKEQAIELMRAVGLNAPEQRYHAYPHELSGGMKQRIVIAIALACGSKIVYCDEPTSALDVTTQAQIMDLLERLRATRGITTVVITHDLALAASRAQQVLVMYAGQAVETLPSADLAARARMPYTHALIDAVPDPDEAGSLPQPIEGLPPDPANPLPGCPFQPRCSRAVDTCATACPDLVVDSPGHLLRCWNPVPTSAHLEVSPA
jgi:oligopeptide/dipeptide ABC transporter ATP-binding protein